MTPRSTPEPLFSGGKPLLRTPASVAARMRVALLLATLGLAACSGGDGGGGPVDDDGWMNGGTERIVVLGTTDVHGWLLPWDYEQGTATARALASLAPLVDSIRAAHPGRVILVDSGDLLQGSPMAAAYTPLAPGEVHPVIAAMNVLAYDAAALGNHEFNFGIEHLNRTLADAQFPFLAANVREVGTGVRPWPGTTMIERELGDIPVRIGVASALPPGVAVWDRDHVEGRLEFLPILASLREAVSEMRAAGVDLVIVAAHSGFEGTSYDAEGLGLGPENEVAALANEVPGIHGIFMGHTHREVADTVVNGVRVAQGGARATSLAVMEFALRPSGEGWEVTGSRGRLLRPDPDDIPVLDVSVLDVSALDDAASPTQGALYLALASAHERTLARVNRQVATAQAPWEAARARVEDTPLLQWISEVQLQASGAQLSAVAAFSLEAGIPQGVVTVAHLARLYPYDNNLLRMVEISGAELRAYLETSARYFLPCPNGECERIVNPEWPGYNFDVVHGIRYTLDLTQPVGARVTRLETLEGTPISDADRFTLALNNYRQSGGGGFPGVSDAPLRALARPVESVSLRDLLQADLERRGTIGEGSAPFEPTWELVPAALREQAYREMHRLGGR
jgi:2',3'-cyclic-nucleotide 2'-phosphodiesterase (5'-nucleotidase family)